MDKKDLRLLEALDDNPRILITQLAKAIAVSPQVATYRLHRLFEKGVLQKASAIVNLSKLGYEHYRVFFKFKNVTEKKKKEVYDYLKKHKSVFWSAKVGTEYDLLCVFFVEDFQKYDDFLNTLNEKFPKVLHDYHAFYGTHHEYYGHKHWTSTRRIIASEPVKASEKIYELDNLDKKILKNLVKDCRIPSFQLGNKLGVNYKTIQNRIKILERKKVIIGYRLFINDKQNPPFIVLFSYDNFNKKKEKMLFREPKENKFVTQSIKLFGEWNLFVIIRTKDLEKLQNIVIDLRDRYDVILNYRIIPQFTEINLLPIS
jgi:DNA-binding Lrp family transcriptional regulator